MTEIRDRDEVSADPDDHFQASARIGHSIEKPTRLEDGDLVEAVSHAVLRELEGGLLNLPSALTTTVGYIPWWPPQW
jgi:hypothetical protein